MCQRVVFKTSMKRRTLLGFLTGGATLTTGAAYVNHRRKMNQSIEAARQHEASEPQSRADLSEEEIQELLDESVEEAYEKRVENGELVHGHNVELISVDDISDTGATIEMTVSINPENDYTVNIHYNPVTVDAHGQWVYENYTDPMYSGSEPEYNERTNEWVVENENTKRVRYDFNDQSPGEVIASRTIPSEAFWDHDYELGERRHEPSEYRMPRRDNVHGYGWSYLNEYEFEFTPELYETFVLTVTWDDENTQSPRDNEILGSTPPMMRVNEDAYLYPRTNDGNENQGSVIHPTWEESVWIDNDEDRQYSSDDVYQNHVETDSEGTSFSQVTRLSDYGRFSPRLRGEYSDRRSVDVASVHGPEYWDSNMAFPWSISYDISWEERSEAQNVASGARTSSSSQVPAVRDLINSPEVMNHDLIQNIASKLGDVCEMMNATHPSEQVRVVCDFVQYFSHTQEGTSPFAEPQSLHPGTAHPVVTLHRALGDCKDYTVLGNALLQQEPFNMNPNAIVLPGVQTYIAEDDEQGEVGHISTALPMSDLGFDEFDVVETVGEPVVGDFETVFIDGVEHAYVEMSGPFEIGYISTSWLRRTNPVSMNEYISQM